jgi:hypothetical protein
VLVLQREREEAEERAPETLPKTNNQNEEDDDEGLLRIILQTKY